MFESLSLLHKVLRCVVNGKLYKCPRCNYPLDGKQEESPCPNCGQPINWEGIEIGISS